MDGERGGATAGAHARKQAATARYLCAAPTRRECGSTAALLPYTAALAAGESARSAAAGAAASHSAQPSPWTCTRNTPGRRRRCQTADHPWSHCSSCCKISVPPDVSTKRSASQVGHVPCACPGRAGTLQRSQFVRQEQRGERYWDALATARHTTTGIAALLCAHGTLPQKRQWCLRRNSVKGLSHAVHFCGQGTGWERVQQVRASMPASAPTIDPLPAIRLGLRLGQRQHELHEVYTLMTLQRRQHEGTGWGRRRPAYLAHVVRHPILARHCLRLEPADTTPRHTPPLLSLRKCWA